MFSVKRLLLLLSLMVFTAAATGCSSVNYVKDVDQSMQQLKSLNDQLNVAKRNADSPAFIGLLDDMNEEAERVIDLEPGWMAGKLAKEVRMKNEKISGLIGDIKEAAKAGTVNNDKLDPLMEQLSDEIREALE